MTTFSKFLLNPNRRTARKLLLDPQKMHATVRAMFPPDLDESASRVLWRVDASEHHHTLYVVGPEKPTVVQDMEDSSWDTRPPQIADYTRLLDSLRKGQQWRFDLVANPTYSESQGAGKRGKIRAHVSAPHQLEWLYAKAPHAGFQISEEAAQVVGRGGLDFYRGHAGARNRVRLVTARFHGVLEVTDAEQLRHTLTHGLGRGRGYGCGLLTLSRR